MKRRIAVVGDTLTSGGTILDYEQAHGFHFHQNKAALIGNTAHCETCDSDGVIAMAGGPYRIGYGTMPTRNVALDGDIVLCKCGTPPRIVARLSGQSWCDDQCDLLGTVVTSRAAGGTARSVVRGAFDEQANATGAGMCEGYPWCIETADGRVMSGRLDSSGVLPRIYTERADTYTIYWGDEALAHAEWQ